MSGELYDLALSVPWCITAEALEAILSIAARDPLPEDEIARRMHGPKSLALRKGQRREDSGRITMQGNVAVIGIDGPIYRYADIFTKASGGVTTDALALDVQKALDDPQVSALLLAIDSPGGEATGINELSDTIYAARARKPIVAYIEGYGASGAYWLASAADLVVVDDTAFVGSIGTVMGVPDPTKRPSYRIDFVSRQSPKKRPDVTTDAGRAVIQALVDRMTDVFVAKVARNRGIDAASVLAIEGAMLVGQDAVEAGLADIVGSEEGAIQQLTATSIPVRILPRPSFLRISGTHAAQEEAPHMPGDSKGFWAGFWGGAKEAGIVPAAESAVGTIVAAEPLQLQSVQSKAADDEKAAAVAAENAELRKQLNLVRAQQIQTEAEAFVKEQLGAGHLYPAEQGSVLALYVRAAEIDATSPREDGQPSCVALIKAAYAIRPAASITRRSLAAPSKGAVVLANNATDDEEQAELERVDLSAREYAKRTNGKR